MKQIIKINSEKQIIRLYLDNKLVKTYKYKAYSLLSGKIIVYNNGISELGLLWQYTIEKDGYVIYDNGNCRMVSLKNKRLELA